MLEEQVVLDIYLISRELQPITQEVVVAAPAAVL
jgi:hypothetical protein